MLFGRKRSLLTKSVTVQLTPLGKNKAEKWAGDGDEARILVALNEMGASTIKEVADEVGISSRSAEKLMQRLIRRNQVQIIRSEM